jgi:ribonuclease HI
VKALYTDGGMIGGNPSEHGGTWAWVRVEYGVEFERSSGVLLPADLNNSTVSNNNSELYALLEGILHLPQHWEGDVCCDSAIALGWFFHGYKQNSIPMPLRKKLWHVQADVKERGLSLNPVLHAGHPTKADLAAGLRMSKAPHLPVSRWNVLCDDLCGKRGRLHMLSLRSAASAGKAEVAA